MVSNLYTSIIGRIKKWNELKTKKLKHTHFPMKTMTCLSQVMDVIDFIVNLYNVRSVKICAKSVGYFVPDNLASICHQMN